MNTKEENFKEATIEKSTAKVEGVHYIVCENNLEDALQRMGFSLKDIKAQGGSK